MKMLLTDNNNEAKKAKGTKKCLVKRKLKFEDYKHCLETTQLENKIKIKLIIIVFEEIMKNS